MLPLPRGAVWQALFFLCAVLFINGVYSEGRVVCYYTNWSVYRPGTAKFNPQNINPYLCTHLVYAFGGFTKDNQMKPFDKYQDIEQGGYAKFTGLKTYNKQLKTMIAVGGWNEASSRFSPLMANPERRHQFIKNILKFLRQNHFDGLDLDWEYPAHREGGKSRDKDNYAQFVQELRAEFERESEKTGRPRLLITMAVPAGIEYIEKGYDIPKLNKYLDWFNVLTYDFHSSHEPSVNHHAPLYSLEEESEYNYDTELNIDYAIKFYLKAGADRDKLVLGIPTYGRTYTLINEDSTDLGAPAEAPGEQGDATREKGYLAYYEICQNLKDDPEWTIVQPNPNAVGPYAYRRNQWVGYDDEDIVRKKAQYVVENGLGGIMFWAIDNDDFRGTCTGKPYPLIEAAKAAMLESLGLGINEVAKPSPHKKPSRSRSRENSSSTRNRIGGSVSEKSVNEYKETSRGSGSRKRTKTSTTSAPSTTIKLTNPEGSSLYVGGRTTTPAPPTTPDPGADFKCEEEGFFQHPRDCKKYFWCLDSGPSGLGIVAHQFTCPSGLYFNPAADSCDFARNVPCKTKKSTTAAPITTTTSTTVKPTSANRVTAATSRTTFFRTTTSTTTTTTTTPSPVEEYDDDEDEEVAHNFKDKESEEDPKVIKELIELIRKVGGIEELEKHLLRKDDGSFSIKENLASPTDVSTTASPISKTLYDKVLSRPNTYNSFRNRFASTLRNSGQAKVEQESVSTRSGVDEEEINQGRSNSGDLNLSKYSSVVRGNSRQGPQNEGLEKLSEFDGFLKERKQYVTINRNRGSSKQTDEEDNEEDIGKSSHADEEYEVEEDEVKASTTKKPAASVTPSYSSIRRTRPTTSKKVLEDDDEEEEEEAEKDKKVYSSLSRTRGRYTTTEKSTSEESSTNANRYKYLDRTRPTKATPIIGDNRKEETHIDDNDEEEDDVQEDQNENVKLQHKSTLDSTKTPQEQQEQAQTTTRVYGSIGRRRPTTTTEKTETTTTSTTSETPNLDSQTNEIILTNEAQESTQTSTTTINTNNPTNIPITSTTISPVISTTTIPLSNEIEQEFSTNPIESSNQVNSEFQSTNPPPQEIISLTTIESDVEVSKQSQNVNETEDLTAVTAKTTINTLTTTDTTTDGDNQTEDEKFQFNRSRTTPGTPTTTTTQKETGIADQVNHLVDDENEEDLKNNKEEEKESGEDDTIRTSPTTTPTQSRLSIYQIRRPNSGLNANSTEILNQNTTILENNSQNLTINKATNDTNTETVTIEPDIENLTQSLNDLVEPTTQSPSGDITPTKRFRKVIRKLIRPVTSTTETTLDDKNIETETTIAPINKTPVIENTRNRTRFGLNRSISTIQTQTQVLNTSDDTEKTERKENNALLRNRSRFSSLGSRPTSERPTFKIANLSTASRSRFSPRGSTRRPAVTNDDEENSSEENEDEDEGEEKIEVKKPLSANPILVSRRPFFNRNGASTTVKSVDADNSTPTQSTTTTEKVNVLQNSSDEVTDEEDNELIAEIDDEDNENKNLEQSSDLQKLREKVKAEQAKGNKDNGIINTRLKKILVVRKNGTSATRTEISAADLNNVETDQEEDSIQKIRNKVKLEQSKGDQDLGVVSSRLKKLLEQRSKLTNATTPYLVATKDVQENEEETNNLDLQKIRNKVKLEQERGDQDNGVISTRFKQLLSEKSNSSISVKENNEENDENEQTEKNTDTDIGSIVQPKPFSPRRPLISGSRIKPTSENSTVDDDVQTVTNAPTVTSARPTFRRKLIAKRPYAPNKSNISTTVAPTVPTRPTRKFLRRKNGPGRFAPFNAGNRNNGEGFIRTNPRDSQLPGTTRFKTEGRGQNEQDTNDDYDYESEENDNDTENENENENENGNANDKPITPATIAVTVRPPGLFNRPLVPILKKPTETIKSDGDNASKENDNKDENDNDEEEEDDDEDDEEEEANEGDEQSLKETDDQQKNNENKPKFNSPSLYRPKENRVPPGARPSISPSGPGNVPFNARNRLQSNTPKRLNSGGFTGRYGTPQFGRSTTARSRVINRPSGVAPLGLTIRPVAVDFERTTPALPTKPAPFIPTNTRTYERKYVGSSTETPETNVDNSLIEDLNIEALNARNKKIFDINSKKHTTLKPKISIPTPLSPTDQESNLQNTRQNTENENDDNYTAVGEQSNVATTTPRTPTNTVNSNINDNIISSQDNVYGSSTPETPTTTLLHVFTLTDEEQTNRPPTANGNVLLPRILAERIRPKHKVVEVNRIVEINSKEDKLRRKSKANQEFLKPIGTSQLKVESLPHVEHLGEISVVKYVHLVDGSDISVDGHSTVADYTPTDPTIPRSSLPVRNILPDEIQREYAQLHEGPRYVHVATTEGASLRDRNGKALVPEVIREAVETSTIALEGLFDNARKSKELNTIDENAYFAYGINIDSTTQTPIYTPENIVNEQIDSSTEKDSQNVLILNNDQTSTITSSESIKSTIQETISAAVSELKNVNVETTETPISSVDITTVTTENPTKATTVTAALFPTYVRPIVPLLRPESNESSPLVISIANLDKVILSKVEKAQKDLITIEEKNKENQNSHTNQNEKNEQHEQNVQNETVTEIADSNSAFSSRHASVVDAPTNLIVDSDIDTDQQKTQQSQGTTKLVAVSVGSTSSLNVAGNEIDKNTNINSNTNLNTNENIITSNNSVSSVNNINNNNSNSNSNVSSSSGSSSNVSEQISFRTETNVVRMKKPRSRKSKSRKLKNSRNATTTTTTTVVPEISTTSVATAEISSL